MKLKRIGVDLAKNVFQARRAQCIAPHVRDKHSYNNHVGKRPNIAAMF